MEKGQILYNNNDIQSSKNKYVFIAELFPNYGGNYWSNQPKVIF